MNDDISALTELNQKIGTAEDNGDMEWLASILAPKLAFQRADGVTCDDQVDFLQKVAAKDPSDHPRITEVIQPIEVMGDRAIVKCIVTQGDKKFHNLRLFVRRKDQPSPYAGWKLMGWANERS